MNIGPVLDHIPNRLHEGTARISIGLMPVSYDQVDSPPQETVNASITGFKISEFDLKYATQAHYKAVVHIPVSEDNAYDNKLIVVQMIADSRLENYWNLWRYMQTIRTGFTDGFPITDKNDRVYGNNKSYRNRLTWIPRIDIIQGDDSLQTHQRTIFRRCYPLVLSELNMDFQDSNPVKFSISFIFSNVEVVRNAPPSSGTGAPPNVIE